MVKLLKRFMTVAHAQRVLSRATSAFISIGHQDIKLIKQVAGRPTSDSQQHVLQSRQQAAVSIFPGYIFKSL